MDRRDLLILSAGTAVALPLAARAQRKAMPVIGWLSTGSPGPYEPYLAAFRRGLSETGFVDGQDLAIEHRWAQGSFDRLPASAADLVGRKVDLIAAIGGPPSALAAESATATIPTVASSGDPVGDGLVDSLARPGGNLTTISNLSVGLVAKRLELLAELVPQAKVIAPIVNPNQIASGNERMISGAREAARANGVQLVVVRAGAESEIDAAFATLAQLNADGLVIGADPFFTNRREQFAAGFTPCGSGDPSVARIRRRRRPDKL